MAKQSKNYSRVFQTSSLFTASVITGLFSWAAIAQSTESSTNQLKRNKYSLPFIESAPKVDGVMDESYWQSALVMELKYENNPGEGTPAPVKTEVFLYQDGNALNVAFKAYDPEPEKIRASLRDRDALWADDNIGIIIDTFNDERSGFEFFVNPLGAQADMKMEDSDGWREDDSWDAIWESAGNITDFGYVVEMRIPFTALRFSETQENQIWNFAGWRNYPRDVRVQMATHKRDRNIKCSLCQFEQIEGFAGVSAGNSLQLTPTLTVSRFDEKTDVPGEWQEGDVEVEPGLDIRWGITQDMVLNATINPDFSQVEADASQLDVNNTYSLFYSEKRPFFLDGASYFDTARFNLVHTRNIAEPDYGLKVTGKTGRHSYGVMVANDENTSFLMPGNQGSSLASLEQKSEVAIARYKSDVGDRSNVGVLMTHRQGDNYENTVLSVDGTQWFSQSDVVQYQVARSESQNPDSVVEDFEVGKEQSDTAVSIDYAHRTRDYNLRASYSNIGEDFRADLGFQSRANIERIVLGGRRNYFGDSDDTLTRWGYFGDWDKTYDQNGTVIEEEVELHGNLQGQMQFFMNFGVVHRERLYDDVYFDETQFMTYFEFNPWSNLEFGTFIRFGKQIDFANTRLGDVVDFEPRINWDVNQHINVEFRYNYSQLDVDGGRLFTANQSDIRFGYQFDMHSILKFIVKYTDIERDQALYLYEDPEDLPDENNKYFSTQLIYSYKINPQTLFFVGYSDGGFKDDELDSLERNQRTVFTKFSYAYQM